MSNSKYDDIINLPHHVSKIHSHMTLYNRSAQFAPFSALTGYNDAIDETSRLTDERIELDDGLKEMINNKLSKIKSIIKQKPLISVTYFVKDKYKKGGSYKTIKSNIIKIDEYENVIIFINKLKIPICEIIDLKLLDTYF